MTQSRKQPVFDTKRKIYFKAQFKYILPLFRSLYLLEHVPEKVLGRGEILKAGSIALDKSKLYMLQHA